MRRRRSARTASARSRPPRAAAHSARRSCPARPDLPVYADRFCAYRASVFALGEAALHDAVQAFRYVNLVAYIALGAVTLAFWFRRRDRASMWAAVAFGSLGLLELLTLVPNHPGNIPERGVGRV